MENPKLKDIYFSREFVEKLIDRLSSETGEFKTACFVDCLEKEGLAEGELKEKMSVTTRCLHRALPMPYPQALEVLRKVAPLFSGFNAMVFPDFVGTYGLEHWELSVEALREFTSLCSSEYGVRPFLNQDLDRMMVSMQAWALDADEHVRRLASEGCRPRLPWAPGVPALKKDPRSILPILEQLKNDPSEYVRRSVANNLNDISKDHPDLVLHLCRQWFGEGEETDQLIKHALRTLLKSGNTGAMRLFGFGNPEEVCITNLILFPPAPAIGDTVEYSFDLDVEGKETLKLRLELLVRFVRKGGKTSQKVFQIREGSFESGNHTIRRSFSFRDFSTRKHYPGEHNFTILVNGVKKKQLTFDLAAQ
ncbi:MAG: DNA alkylation repair protein [Anaerolineales bacterium]|nr:DNA alkylation repair protein [Anaerolineales bacterium]